MDAPTLLDLRRKIDAIDGKLHELIRERAALVGSISAAKPDGGMAPCSTLQNEVTLEKQ